MRMVGRGEWVVWVWVWTGVENTDGGAGNIRDMRKCRDVTDGSDFKTR